MTSDGYFSGASGTRYGYSEIAARIRREAPLTLGKHIFVQLEAIGLLYEMKNGTTPCALPFTFAEAETSLLVPSGSLLIEGELYLRLCHRRKDPAQDMDEVGFVGPTFGPLNCVVQRYFDSISLDGRNLKDLWLERHADMIAWDGAYYGDIAIFVARKHDRG
jgi:hypothetical protein